jgi:hypothetical protein
VTAGPTGTVLLAAATPLAALGAALYLGLALVVLRLAVRWAREALGEPAPVPTPKG